MEDNMAGRLDDVSVRWNLYRNPSRGKIAGVCAGLADRTGIKANWIRLGFILAAVTVFHAIPAVVLYLALALVMRPRDEPIGYVTPDGMAGYQMPGGVPPMGPGPVGPAPAWVAPGTRLNDVRTRFTAIDARLARIEAVVTSEELSLRRKFRDLGG
jgi:phage shock protein C